MGSTLSSENDRSAVGTLIVNDEVGQAAAATMGKGRMMTTLQLYVSCQNLHNKDKRSLSDPFVVVYMRSGPEKWVEIGRSEIISNTLNPNFVKSVSISYRFEEVQHIRVEVYDADDAYSTADASSTMVLSRQDFQGYVETTVGTVVGSRGQTYKADILKGTPPKADRGELRITAQDVAKDNSACSLNVHVELGKKKAATFLVLSRVSLAANSTAPATPFFKTEVKKKSKNQAYATINCPLSTMCNSNKQQPILIECYSYNKKGNHVALGACKLSLDELIELSMTRAGAQLTSETAKIKLAGTFHVDSCTVAPRPTFFEFISNGCSLQFVCAIDFTGSNGNPLDPGSLHYMTTFNSAVGLAANSTQPNQYVQAIRGVGAVLQCYDADNLYPVIGFGGIPPRQSEVSHCFEVGGPAVSGVDGILAAYNHILPLLHLSGPTLFAPVINHCAALAASTISKDPSDQNYWVMLLMTDGLICDMDATVDAIVRAADLPISIIIVGVGDADFAAMRELDGDGKIRLKSSTGKLATRDIVQFVCMRDFRDQGGEALAREVLAELPGQLLDYMRLNGIIPPPRTGPSVSQRFLALTPEDVKYDASVYLSSSAPNYSSLVPPPQAQSSTASNGGYANSNGLPPPPSYNSGF